MAFFFPGSFMSLLFLSCLFFSTDIHNLFFFLLLYSSISVSETCLEVWFIDTNINDNYFIL